MNTIVILFSSLKKDKNIGKFRNYIRTPEVELGTVFFSKVVVWLVATPASEPDPGPIRPHPLSLLEEKADWLTAALIAGDRFVCSLQV